jgi:hypothetical protein
LISEAQLMEIFRRWQQYHMTQQPELHPTHRTPEEKTALRRKRAQRKRTAARKTR